VLLNQTCTFAFLTPIFLESSVAFIPESPAALSAANIFFLSDPRGARFAFRATGLADFFPTGRPRRFPALGADLPEIIEAS